MATCRELVLDYVSDVTWRINAEIGNDYKKVRGSVQQDTTVHPQTTLWLFQFATPLGIVCGYGWCVHGGFAMDTTDATMHDATTEEVNVSAVVVLGLWCIGGVHSYYLQGPLADPPSTPEAIRGTSCLNRLTA